MKRSESLLFRRLTNAREAGREKAPLQNLERALPKMKGSRWSLRLN